MTVSDARRVVLVTVLLAIGATGLQARGAFSHAANATASALSGSALAITLAVTEGVALVAFIVVLVSARRNRAGDDDETEYEDVIPRWLRYPLFVLALAALAVPLYLLYTLHHKGGGPRSPGTTAPGGRLSTPKHVTVPAGGGLVPIAIGVGIGIGALLVIALLSRRRSRGDREPGPLAAARRGLASRLAAAADALRTAADDPRAAIIACYAELERGFAAAGSVPREADTPAELLGRAVAAGLVRSQSAADLTGLFRRARYSTEPLTTADSEAAVLALDAMRSELAVPQGREGR